MTTFALLSKQTSMAANLQRTRLPTQKGSQRLLVFDHKSAQLIIRNPPKLYIRNYMITILISAVLSTWVLNSSRSFIPIIPKLYASTDQFFTFQYGQFRPKRKIDLLNSQFTYGVLLSCGGSGESLRHCAMQDRCYWFDQNMKGKLIYSSSGGQFNTLWNSQIMVEKFQDGSFKVLQVSEGQVHLRNSFPPGQYRHLKNFVKSGQLLMNLKTQKNFTLSDSLLATLNVVSVEGLTDTVVMLNQNENYHILDLQSGKIQFNFSVSGVHRKVIFNQEQNLLVVQTQSSYQVFHFSPNQLYFITSIPAQPHTFSLVYLERNDGLFLVFSGLFAYVYYQDAIQRSLSAVAIIGLVLVLILLAISLFVWSRRRMAQMKQNQECLIHAVQERDQDGVATLQNRDQISNSFL